MDEWVLRRVGERKERMKCLWRENKDRRAGKNKYKSKKGKEKKY